MQINVSSKRKVNNRFQSLKQRAPTASCMITNLFLGKAIFTHSEKLCNVKLLSDGSQLWKYTYLIISRSSVATYPHQRTRYKSRRKQMQKVKIITLNTEVACSLNLLLDTLVFFDVVHHVLDFHWDLLTVLFNNFQKRCELFFICCT